MRKYLPMLLLACVGCMHGQRCLDCPPGRVEIVIVRDQGSEVVDSPRGSKSIAVGARREAPSPLFPNPRERREQQQPVVTPSEEPGRLPAIVKHSQPMPPPLPAIPVANRPAAVPQPEMQGISQEQVERFNRLVEQMRKEME